MKVEKLLTVRSHNLPYSMNRKEGGWFREEFSATKFSVWHKLGPVNVHEEEEKNRPRNTINRQGANITVVERWIVVVIDSRHASLASAQLNSSLTRAWILAWILICLTWMLNLITVRLLLRSTSNHFQTQGGRNVDPEPEWTSDDSRDWKRGSWALKLLTKPPAARDELVKGQFLTVCWWSNSHDHDFPTVTFGSPASSFLHYYHLNQLSPNFSVNDGSY